MPAFQAGDGGSTPLARSTRLVLTTAQTRSWSATTLLKVKY